MSFYNDNDIRLENKLNEIKQDMEEALKLIEICENDAESDFNTHYLKKRIERFCEDF